MKKDWFISLKVKMSIGVIFICFLIGILALLLVNRIATDIVDREYSDKAEQITQAMVHTLDPKEVSELTSAVMDIYKNVDGVVPSSEWGSDSWNEYMSHYEGIKDMPLFIKLRDHFRMYQEIYKVDCIYIVNYKTSINHAIYIVDGAYEDACDPGVCDSFLDGVWPDENNPIIPATITNEEVYGWLVTAGYPVIYEGEVVSHLCVDISMNDIKAKERRYVMLTNFVMVGLTALLLAISLWYVGRNVVKPVTMLSDTAKNYCSENNDVVHHAFEKLSINTHDEIRQLLVSMKQMEADMNENINTLIDTKVDLREAEEKANIMQELAIKDSLTGVRNRLGYDAEVKRLEKELSEGFDEFGIAMVDLNYLKKINDTCGHENGNVAIQTLCTIICEVFDHSPVFRIGGDEFAVILMGVDYAEIDRHITEFNSIISKRYNDSSLAEWERISAAIGYAGFDKNMDKTVDDVFKKADKAMYERKAAMKAERTD